MSQPPYPGQGSDLLGGLTPQAFLDRHWQKAPLLVRGAIPRFTSPLSPAELAGLACETPVESRLVLERGGARPWEVRHGPFNDEDFAALPATHWTLLVQDVDKRIPEVAHLLRAFRFIPDWRVDDVMVSYAPDGGSVGPHLDQYDVFLLQGLGRRRWRVQRHPDPACLPDLDLRILRHFTPEQEWVLEAGDLLYLPPGVAHHGIALGDSMTFSIGYRAFSARELVAAWLEHRLAHLDPDLRYADPDLRVPANPAEIGPAEIRRLHQVLLHGLTPEAGEFAAWVGALATELKPGLGLEEPDTPVSPREFLRRLRAAGTVHPSPESRFALVRAEDGGTWLAVDGCSHSLNPALQPLAVLLCERRALDRTELEPLLAQPALELLAVLYNRGQIRFAADDA